jgi:O-antigen ligase
MRSVLASAMVITMALCFLAGVILFGGVSPNVAAPMFALAFFAGLVWAIQIFLSPDAPWKKSPMNWPVVAVVAYAVVRYFTSPFEYDARIELFQIGLCALAYFIAANQFNRPIDRTLLLAVLAAVALAESAYAFWQFGAKSDAVLFWTRPEGYRGRGSGTYICPNNMAALLEMALGLIVARAALVHVRKVPLERFVLRKILLAYAALMAVGGIVITFSRTGWIVTVAGLLLFLFWGDWRPRLSWPRVAVVFAALGLMWLVASKFPPVRNYLIQSFTVRQTTDTRAVALRDPSMGGRLHMFTGTLKLIGERPVLGSGLGSWQWFYGKYKHPIIQSHPEHTHNEFLNLTSDYGLVGLLLMGTFIVGFYRHALAASAPALPAEQRAFAIGSAISISTVLAHSWFDFPFHIPANALLLAVIAGGTAAINDAQGRFVPMVMKPFARYSLASVLLLGCVTGAWLFGRTALAAHYSSLGSEAKLRFIADKSVALDYFSRAILLDPNNPEPHAKIGDIYRGQAAWRVGSEKMQERKQLALQAVDAYRHSIRLNSFQSDVLLRLGRACDLAGEDEEALKSYLRAVEVDPVNAYVHAALGRHYRDRGDLERAREAFNKSWALNTTSDLQAPFNLEELGPPPAAPVATNSPALAPR